MIRTNAGPRTTTVVAGRVRNVKAKRAPARVRLVAIAMNPSAVRTAAAMRKTKPAGSPRMAGGLLAVL